MAKRRLKWEVAAWSESSGVGEALTICPFGGARAYVELVSAAAVEASSRDGIWVERVIGQTFHATYNNSGPPGPFTNLKERVSVGHRFDPNVPTNNDVGLPWSAIHAGVDNFLWERTMSAYEGEDFALDAQNFQGPTDVPFWSCIDIRVGRMLRPTQFLAYSVQTDPGLVSVGDNVITHGWLRVLISE